MAKKTLFFFLFISLLYGPAFGQKKVNALFDEATGYFGLKEYTKAAKALPGMYIYLPLL